MIVHAIPISDIGVPYRVNPVTTIGGDDFITV
jgi:hypothetical protein